MASPTNLLPVPDYTEVAQDLRESYEEIESQGLESTDFIPAKDLASPAVDVANILWGDEAAAVGLTYDKKGLDLDIETAKDAWVKHPIASGVAVATTIIPVLGAFKKLRRASNLAEISDEMISKAGFVDEGIDIAKIADADKDLMRINADYYANYKDKTEKVKLIEDQIASDNPVAIKDRAFRLADKALTNKYLEDIDPLNAYDARAEWIRSTSQMMKEDGRFARHLKNLPPDDAVLGTRIARMLADPKAIDEIPDKYKEAALLFAEDKKNLDLAAIKEGLVSKEEVAHVGDTWFATTREGTQQDFGKYTTILDTTSSANPRVLRVPKTSSPNLLTRIATKEEVKTTIDRQLAAELLAGGEKEEALRLLKGVGYDDAKKLIKEGDFTGAINLLSASSKIDFTPKSLTFNTLFNQKLLLDNFRMIRDLALNSDITKSSEYIAALSPRARRGYMKLDALPGSDRLRRMVAVSKQVDPKSVTELGWVPKGVFRELSEITGGATKEAVGGWMSFISALHKTGRCIVGETRVLTEEGYIKIADAYEFKDGYNDLCQNDTKVWTGVEFQRPTKSFKAHEEETIKIELSDGTLFQGTMEHPILTENRGLVKLSDLNIGDTVKTYYEDLPFPTHKIKISWNPWTGTSNGNSTITIDEDLAELLGWILGDGNLHYGKNSIAPYIRITIGWQDFDWSSKRLSDICNRLGIPYTLHRESKPRRDGHGILSYFNISNVNFGRLIQRLGLEKNKKKNLQVPDVIFRSPKSIISAFLSGLINTDGSVSKRTLHGGALSITSISEKFAREIHLLFKWLGCRATVKFARMAGTHVICGRICNTKSVWRVSVYGRIAFSVLKKLDIPSMPRKAIRISECLEASTYPRYRKNKVLSICKDHNKTTVYDICLKNPHLFITENIVSHNTAFNLPTHFSNIAGNWAFLVNAGVNPFSAEFIKLQQMSARAIKQIQKASRAGADVTELKDFGTLDSLVGGKKISLADELNSKELNDIIEKSTLTSSEGIGVIEKIAQSKDFLGDIAKFTNKAINATKGYVPADLYLREDAMVKMAYYLQLRQKGFSRAGAAIEVGKRLPMYHSIGGAARTARSWLLPWVSFPAEATRILKNNMVDHPFKTALMLQVPEFAQVGMYFGARAMGEDISYEGIKQRKDQLATWANRPSTIISPFTDRNKDIRSMVLDFLPYTSLMPPTVSSEAPIWKKLPFGLDEPIPIWNGFRLAMTGQDTWGREIPTDPNNPSRRIAVAAMSLMGFMAPPIAEKYLFNPSDIEFGYRFMTEAGKKVNPYTEKPGDPVFDLILNNILPVKSYAASPEQQLANESFTRQQLTNFRGGLAKKWGALLKSGDAEGAAEIMAQIHQTFYTEWGDVGMAQRKMDEWLISHAKTIGQHPQLRGFSKEEIIWKIRNQSEAAADTRTRARAQLIESMRRELGTRGRRSDGGSKSPFFFPE